MTNNNINTLIANYDKKLKLSPLVKKLIEDGVKHFHVKYKQLQKIQDKKRENTFFKINPNEIMTIFLGNIRPDSKQFGFTLYNNKSSELKSIVASRFNGTSKTSSVFEAIIENNTEFITQFLNILYISGCDLKDGIPKKGYYPIIKMTDGTCYHVSCDKYFREHTNWFMFIYFNYFEYTLDNRIYVANKNLELEKIKNKSENHLKLYMHLKTVFDDVDFIYGVMSHLNSDKKVEIFFLMLEKNEGVLGHMPMNSFIKYFSEAHYLYTRSDDLKPLFLKDRMKQMLGEE